MIDLKLSPDYLLNLSAKQQNQQFQSEERTACQITTSQHPQMNRTSKSFAEKRIQSTSTPVSTFSRSSKKIIKQEPTIDDIYNDVRVKISEMESTFKSQHMEREREMLKTYVKILDKIGAEVMTAKQKYLNLDKENLKTDKRLQIVTELNKERQQCNLLTKNIKNVREQIKKFEDENNYLEKEVEALEEIADRKKSLSKSEHQKYRSSKQKAKSLEKRWTYTMKENDRLMTVAKGTIQNSSDKFDINTRTKSYILNSQQPQAHTQQTQRQGKHGSRPQTQQNYLGSRRRKIYFNKALHENVEMPEQP